MATAFQCPSCSRQLYFETGDQSFQVCRHCAAKIIVPSTVIHENEITEASMAGGRSLEAQRDLKLAEIQSELNAGRKINAIKLFREAFGADLSAAKNAVEMLETGMRIPGQALTTVVPDRPIEERIYTTAPVQQGNNSRSATIIFWVILMIGIAIAARFLGGE